MVIFDDLVPLNSRFQPRLHLKGTASILRLRMLVMGSVLALDLTTGSTG